MRIAHVITRMIVGGAQENTLHNCLDLVADHGDEVLLLTGPSLGPEGTLLDRHADAIAAAAGGAGQGGGLRIQTLPSLRRNLHPVRDIAAYRAIRRELRTFAPDVVHTHSAKGGLLGRAAAWSFRVPAVIHTVHGAPFHDYQSPIAREFFRRCERWAAGRCHRMIGVADAMADQLVAAGVAPREKFTTVASGMDVEPFLDADKHRDAVRRRFGFIDDDVVIGKIARLFHLKGHDDLIAAAGRVVAANPHVKFLLVGDGILRDEHERAIAAAGLTDHFAFAGLVDPAEVPAMIGAMDILVHTSLREGLARALPQALIAGRPVISYDVDGAREVCLDGVTGRLIPPRDTNALAAAMIELSGDADLRHRMGGEGQGRFTDRFRHREMTRQIRDLYRHTLAAD